MKLVSVNKVQKKAIILCDDSHINEVDMELSEVAFRLPISIGCHARGLLECGAEMLYSLESQTVSYFTDWAIVHK